MVISSEKAMTFRFNLFTDLVIHINVQHVIYHGAHLRRSPNEWRINSTAFKHST